MQVASSFELAEELRELALDVRRLGNGFRQDPEALCIAKDEIAKRLAGLARQVEEAAR